MADPKQPTITMPATALLHCFAAAAKLAPTDAQFNKRKLSVLFASESQKQAVDFAEAYAERLSNLQHIGQNKVTTVSWTTLAKDTQIDARLNAAFKKAGNGVLLITSAFGDRTNHKDLQKVIDGRITAEIINKLQEFTLDEKAALFRESAAKPVIILAGLPDILPRAADRFHLTGHAGQKIGFTPRSLR